MYNGNNYRLTNYLKGSPVSVKVVNLRKSFGDKVVLKDVSLDVESGQTLVILGKSGAGKSVFLKHIVGLLSADSGLIYFNDEIIDSDHILDSYRIAFVFQSSALFNSMTVEENVGLYLREHRLIKDNETIRKIVSEALEMVGLEGIGNMMPSQLSGGMKRRVATARAIVMNPDMIIFDEPTSGLDPIMTKTIGELINSLKEKVKVTQIVVTHNLELAVFVADKITVLGDGEIKYEGDFKGMSISNDPYVRSFIDTKLENNYGGVENEERI